MLITVSILIIGCDSTSSDDTEIRGSFPVENLESAGEYAVQGSGGLGLIIWENGEILYEEYFQNDNFNFTPTTNAPLFSGTKSFAGLLASFAVEDGLFTFDTPLGELISSWSIEEERGKITIRQLLNLTSGIQTASIGSQQTVEELLSSQMAFERGSTFTYGPTPFYILSLIFSRELGIDPANYLHTKLFTPLGLTSGSWNLGLEQGIRNLSFGLLYPANDWLQVGILLENGGELNGVRILNPETLNELLQPSEAAAAYGITFWLNKSLDPQSSFAERIPGTLGVLRSDRLISDDMPADLYMMSGAFGQKLYIVPSLDLVIVRYGRTLQSDFSDQRFFSLLTEGLDFSGAQPEL
jgi:CubicO group peptidase (beta-lactamase class C family)